jgi:alpha-L-fucosidase
MPDSLSLFATLIGLPLRRIAAVSVVAAAMLIAMPTLADDAATGAAPYKPTWESLAKHNAVPEWFKDAKFGIYFHWGVYSVPAFFNEWYPRWMFFKGHPVYEHHVKTYGDPSKFGYQDFVPMFKAEKFDPDAWAKLFQEAGARFAGPVAEHHDGFAMWKSKATPWNAYDKGPHRDIVGELEKSIRGHGMKFITTFHHARNLQRPDHPGNQPYPQKRYFPDSHFPPIKGMPTSSNDPELELLYGRLPEAVWLDRIWLGELKEVIDGYHPDIIWFDGWLDRIPEEKRREFLAYYFNAAAKRNQEVVVTHKGKDLPQNISVVDLEKGRMNKLTDFWWLTDDTISRGSWCYTEDLKIKPASEVLHVLIDIVSKRGVLLLNISPKADGTIPQNQRDVLLTLGKWLGKYGEAIYDTRPWLVYGEGPTQMKRGGAFVKSITYGPNDVRYTRSKDGSTIYAIVLGQPEGGKELVLKSLGNQVISGDLDVKAVSALGSSDKVEFSRSGDGLKITIPHDLPDSIANVFKISVEGSANLRQGG